MIRFALRCDEGHRFEGWFRSSSDFDTQSDRGLVTCSLCGSNAVTKALMRPAIGSASGGQGGPSAKETTEATGAVAAEPASEPHLNAMKELWSKLQTQARALRANSEYVGPRFAEEARKIHYGETEKRGVYGEASRQEVEALSDEGIVAMPLPSLPEDKN